MCCMLFCVVYVLRMCCYCFSIRVCAACEKRDFFSLQEIYIKKCIFFENNCCFSCVYEKKAVTLWCENEGVTVARIPTLHK